MHETESGRTDAAGRAPEGTDASAHQSGPHRRPWSAAAPGRLMGRGHPAGDFLEAYDWELLERREGYLKLGVNSLPDRVKNPRGQLFGGFTPTYVDVVALFTVFAGQDKTRWSSESWLATTNMRIDYFAPIVGPSFVIESTEEHRRGRTHFVATRFFQGSELAVFALTTMRQVALDRPFGDA